MKKIFILFSLLPFSLFAEINPSDLSGIETDLGKIQDDVSTIEMIGNQSVTHLQYIRTISAEILYLLQDANIGSQLGDVNTKLNGISNRAQTIIDKLNEFLPAIKSNLEAANTTLSIIQTEISYLDDRLETFQSEVNQLLQSIEYKLTDIKTAIIDGFENLILSMTSLQESITIISTRFTELNTIAQNIYTELLSQGYDVKEISNILSNALQGYVGEKVYTISGISSAQVHNIKKPSFYFSKVIQLPVTTNLFNLTTQIRDGIYRIITDVSPVFINQLYRLYDIQTKFDTSLSIQKDISTNVAYIASVITNSHDLLKLIASNVVTIARHTMPTNVADQYETQQQEQIDQVSSSYQEHESDMSAYESSLTHIPSKIQKPLDDGVEYISRLNSPSTFEVNTLDDDIYAAFPDYHSSLANITFSLPIDIKLTPDLKQILSIIRKCVTTVIWVFTFLFSLFLIQKFVQFVAWIMSLLQPYTRDMFGNVGSGSLYKLMGG